MWEEAILAAEAQRYEDPTVMDILATRPVGDENIETAAQSPSPQTELEEWVELGIAIEEKQYIIPYQSSS